MGWTLQEIKEHIDALEAQVRELQVKVDEFEKQDTEKNLKLWEKAEVKRLREQLAHYEDNCTIVWMPEDVLSLDDTLTEEQVSWVLERMEHKHDACLGISWDTIEFWINEVKE